MNGTTERAALRSEAIRYREQMAAERSTPEPGTRRFRSRPTRPARTHETEPTTTVSCIGCTTPLDEIENANERRNAS